MLLSKLSALLSFQRFSCYSYVLGVLYCIHVFSTLRWLVLPLTIKLMIWPVWQTPAKQPRIVTIPQHLLYLQVYVYRARIEGHIYAGLDRLNGSRFAVCNTVSLVGFWEIKAAERRYRPQAAAAVDRALSSCLTRGSVDWYTCQQILCAPLIVVYLW